MDRTGSLMTMGEIGSVIDALIVLYGVGQAIYGRYKAKPKRGTPLTE